MTANKAESFCPFGFFCKDCAGTSEPWGRTFIVAESGVAKVAARNQTSLGEKQDLVFVLSPEAHQTTGFSMIADAETFRNRSLLRGSRDRVPFGRALGAACAIWCVAHWTGSAYASCGDYLHRNGQSVSEHLMLMTEQDAPTEVPIRRCSGPNCSESPLPLSPVPAVPVSLVRSTDTAMLLELSGDSGSKRNSVQVPQSERGAFFEPSSVFRPPA